MTASQTIWKAYNCIFMMLASLTFMLNPALSQNHSVQSKDVSALNTLYAKEWVVLLHGLVRTKSSMSTMETHLKQAGYNVVNQGYPSQHIAIEELANTYLPKAIQICQQHQAHKIHFVTHSMGGILVRYYLKHNPLKELGHVVMLSPPNQGSEVVDVFKSFWGFKWLNGPAGQQLGTSLDSLPNSLGKVNFKLGVITGDQSINWILSCFIPGPDDGKVSVERAQVDGMADFRVIHATHPYIMKNAHAIELTLHFLKNGVFY